MKILIVIILLLSTFSLHLNGQLTINIEAEDLRQISEIFERIMHQSHPSTRISPVRCSFIPLIKKLSLNLIQMCGVMMTLFGANILTVKYEYSHRMDYSSLTVTNIKTKISPPEMCHHDYGCSENLCWRTCDEPIDENVNEELGNKWCFTTPVSNRTYYQPCKLNNDCSPCWGCMTPCAGGLR